MASPPASSTGSTKLDGAIQKTAANTPEKLSGIALYSRFALAGAVCCSVTHGGLTPVDVYVRVEIYQMFNADDYAVQGEDQDTARSCYLQ